MNPLQKLYLTMAVLIGYPEGMNNITARFFFFFSYYFRNSRGLGVC